MAGCPHRSSSGDLGRILGRHFGNPLLLCLGMTLGPAMIFTATLEVNSNLLGSRSASLLLSYKDSLQGGCWVGLNHWGGLLVSLKILLLLLEKVYFS